MAWLGLGFLGLALVVALLKLYFKLIVCWKCGLWLTSFMVFNVTYCLNYAVLELFTIDLILTNENILSGLDIIDHQHLHLIRRYMNCKKL